MHLYFLKCILPKCILAKCSRLACLLSFASLFFHDVCSHLHLLLCVGQATIRAAGNMRCRLFLAERKLSQSAIVSMFCFPQTFFIMITQYNHHSQNVQNILLKFSLFQDSMIPMPAPIWNFLFKFEILTILLWSDLLQFLHFSKPF